VIIFSFRQQKSFLPKNIATNGLINICSQTENKWWIWWIDENM